MGKREKEEELGREGEIEKMGRKLVITPATGMESVHPIPTNHCTKTTQSELIPSHHVIPYMYKFCETHISTNPLTSEIHVPQKIVCYTASQQKHSPAQCNVSTIE